MPLPPGPTFASRLPGVMARTVSITNRIAGSTALTTGRFACTIVPMSGSVSVPGGDRVQTITVDARLYAPIVSAVAARSVVTDVVTRVSYDVVYAQRWDDYIEAFLVRRAT